MLALTHPAGLASLASRGHWRLPKHIEAIDRKLIDIAAGRCKRLIVTMPPRHGKSSLISHYFPAWYLINNPHAKIILASYEASFSAEWGRKAMGVVQEYGGSFGVEVKHNMMSGRHWAIKGAEGEMHTSGVGGPITGKGGNIILDDPVKNAEEAHSQVYRDKTWDWFNSTLYTRMESHGWAIVIQTRWHEDDLAGRLIKHASENWEILNLPALAEENDPLGRSPGEALWPEKFDVAALETIKNQIGSYWFNALYQQRPSAIEGNIFKRDWWKLYDQAPEKFDEVSIFWDMTFKDTKTGSYTVGQVWGRKGKEKYLIDQVRQRCEFTTVLGMVRHLSKKYQNARAHYIEEKANGAAIISALKKEISGLIPINPKESKEARASAISPQVERGEVFLPRHCSFTEDFVEEHVSFPNAAHDDQVDTCSMALAILDGRVYRGAIGGGRDRIKVRTTKGVAPKFS